MKAKILSLALLAAGLAGAAPDLLAASATPAAAIAVPDPAQQMQEWARLFRQGDLRALAQAMTPAGKWEEARLMYELKRLDEVSDQDRAEFAEQIEKITAPDAVERIMAELEPQLVEARAQWPNAMMMGIGAANFALASPETKISDEQRLMLQTALPGVQQWVSSTDFLSADRLREALELLTDAARATGIDELDDLNSLSLEEALDRASPVLTAAKKAARLYGVDLDAMADSLQVEVIAMEGDTAQLRSTVQVFGAPLWHEYEVRLVEGRWYPKGSIHHVHRDHDLHSGDEFDVDADVAVEAEG